MADGIASIAAPRCAGILTEDGTIGNTKAEELIMAGKPEMGREQPDPDHPPEVAQVVKGVWRFLRLRRARGVPEEGFDPREKFHLCDQSCILHDHE